LQLGRLHCRVLQVDTLHCPDHTLILPSVELGYVPYRVKAMQVDTLHFSDRSLSLPALQLGRLHFRVLQVDTLHCPDLRHCLSVLDMREESTVVVRLQQIVDLNSKGLVLFDSILGNLGSLGRKWD
jgi:hypothetical protein